MKRRLAFLLLFLSMAVVAGCGKEANKVDHKTDSAVEEAEMEKEILQAEGGLEATEDFEFLDDQDAEEDLENTSQDDAVQKEEQQGASQSEGTSEESSASQNGDEKTEESSKPESQEKDKNPKPKLESAEKLENPEKQEDKEENEQSEETEKAMTYESFQKLSPAEQQKYMETFADIESFFALYNQVKTEYEKEHPPIILDGNEVNAEDLLGGE